MSDSAGRVLTVECSHMAPCTPTYFCSMHRKADPTHGRIDRDIQRQVEELEPTSLGQRVAMENTLQHRRDQARPVQITANPALLDWETSGGRTTRRGWRVSVKFAWYDLWVGAYIDRKNRVLYVCPLPCLLIAVRRG